MEMLQGIRMNRQEFRDWDARVAARAKRMWQQAGNPEGGPERYLDEARELQAIAENPGAATMDPDEIMPEPESLLAVENQGEFPTTTDQGNEQGYPEREGRPEWKD